VHVDPPWPGVTAPPHVAGDSGPRQWGNISGAAPGLAGASAVGASGGNFLLQSWVYLGIAGLASAFLAWALCEPSFVDNGSPRWGNHLLFPLLVTAISVALAAAESLVERSVQKAVTRGLLAFVLGLVLGFLFDFIANVLYNIGLRIVVQNVTGFSASHPAWWLVRAFAWMVFGVSGGLVYGIAGQSGKKCLYGILGGMLGAGIGGLLFDPICLLTGGGGPSRCIGMMAFGASTGVAIGLVESALKNRWLYVSGGPLAGKQFILYKPITRLGSQQANDIYLFKDLSIAPTHATIELRGPHATLVATGPTFVGGQPVTQRVLRSGDLIQIGRYTFQYQEKQAHR
jgi:Inner membrane component of T3SS, cytoplasmic domain